MVPELMGTRWGTFYVIRLSVVSVVAALLTLGLVRRWGEVLPRWLPALGGREVPPVVVTVLAVGGGVAVIAICALSVANWSSVSGFADNPRSGWAWLMVVCYLPARWPGGRCCSR